MSFFIETIKMVGKVFRANKLRTILTMFGIIIGIFSVTMIFAVSDGTKDKISKEFQEMDQTTITLTFQDRYDEKTGQELEKTIAPYEALTKLVDSSKILKNITVSSPRKWTEMDNKIMQENLENGIDTNLRGPGMYMNGNQDEGANQVNAVGYDFFNVREKLSTKVAVGRLFTKFDEQNKAYFTLLSDQVATSLFGSPRNAINKEVYINHIAYKVIGVLQRNSDQSTGPWDSQYVYPAYILHSTTSGIVDHEQGYYYPEEYIIKVNASNDRDQAKQEIKTALTNYVSETQYSLNMGFGDNQEVTNNIMDLITMVFAGIAGLSLLVGGIGIMNIMLVSVNERIKEIGIRQALGARRKHILMQFLVEAIVLTLLAGIIGMCIAQGAISWLNTQNLGIVLTVNIKIMLSVVLFCSVVGMIFGYYPANKASKLNIADALRYE